MMTLHLWVSLVLATLVYAALASALLAVLFPAQTPASRWSVVAVVAAVVAALMALPGQTAALAAWAGFGRFSMTSGLLALLYLLHPLFLSRPGWRHMALPDGQRRMLIFGVIVAGLVLYPAALGMALPGTATMDIQGSGFGDFRLATILLCLGLALWVLRAYHLCLLLVAAQCAFALQLLPSGNLWDYLIDPWLWLGGMLTVVVALVRPGKAAGPVPSSRA
ncbi:hypothetical protein K8B33_05910 [Alcanivorax sp. JB21]|uniref:hypothetical protein n=1 Tax=Alcanivorax limicola TaxID=2874102 RepID=UPI001CBDBF21|nr:hypothetical protein [Alcanivorax limicola]MBZ2188620.1 hypothetical protein [Alcanivorax limicola]